MLCYDEHLTNIEYATINFVTSRQKTLFCGKIYVGDRCCSRGGFNLFDVGRCSGYQLSFTKIVIFIRLYDMIRLVLIITLNLLMWFFKMTKWNSQFYISSHFEWNYRQQKITATWKLSRPKESTQSHNDKEKREIKYVFVLFLNIII